MNFKSSLDTFVRANCNLIVKVLKYVKLVEVNFMQLIYGKCLHVVQINMLMIKI